MPIIGEIKGFPLIKFKDEEIIRRLQSGNVYLNNLKWFRDYENESGDMIIGDSYEGMLHISDGELRISETGDCRKLANSLIPTVASNPFVFCMSYIDPQVNNFEFNALQREEFSKFGDTALLILDSYEFISRIRNKAKEKGYNMHFGKVHYYNENIDSGDMWISLMRGTYNIAFWKRRIYKYQQEFRMVIDNENYNEDHIELNIGDISDISKVFTSEQILNSKIIKHDR